MTDINQNVAIRYSIIQSIIIINCMYANKYSTNRQSRVHLLLLRVTINCKNQMHVFVSQKSKNGFGCSKERVCPSHATLGEESGYTCSTDARGITRSRAFRIMSSYCVESCQELLSNISEKTIAILL